MSTNDSTVGVVRNPIDQTGPMPGRPLPEDPWKHRSAGMRCRTCIFFVEKAANPFKAASQRGALGRCRRHAPTMSGFPAVFEADWCGDHKLDEEKAS